MFLCHRTIPAEMPFQKNVREDSSREDREMKNELDLIDTIINGSEELDRKEKKIKRIVSIIEGRIEGIPYKKNTDTSFQLETGVPPYYWGVSTIFDSGSCDVCIYYCQRGSSSEVRMIWKDYDDLKADNIDLIYSHLSVLIDGCMKKFPGLLDPFLKATEHAKKTA
jgi:hypothetical protein